jgi:hypothetical protein
MKNRSINFLTILLSLFLSNYGYSQITISPTSGERNNNLTLTISQSSVNFGQGASCICPTCTDVNNTRLEYSQGTYTYYPSNIQVINPNQFKVTFKIPFDAPLGNYTLYSGTGNCTTKGSFQIIEQKTLLSVYPGSTYLGAYLNLSISSTAISFGQGNACACPTCVNVNKSNIQLAIGSSIITPDSVFVISPNKVNALFHIPSYANSGLYQLIVGNGTSCLQTINFLVKSNSTNPIVVIPSPVYLNDSLDLTIDSGGPVLVSSTTPCGFQGQLNVSTNTVYFTMGSTILYPNSVSVATNNRVVHAGIKIPANTSVGIYQVHLGNTNCPTEALLCTNCLSIQPFTPHLSLNTNSSNPGNKVTLTISGSGAQFSLGKTCMPSGVLVDSTNIVFSLGTYTLHPTAVYVDNTNNTVKADLTIPIDAPLGSYDVRAGSTACNVISCAGCFKVYPAPNTLTLSPSKGYVKQTVTVALTSSGYPFAAGHSCLNGKVLVDSSNVVFSLGTTKLYPSSIVIDTSYKTIYAKLSIPSNAPSGLYDIKVGSASCNTLSCTGCFSVEVPYPSISVLPTVGDLGQNISVTIKGSNVAFGSVCLGGKTVADLSNTYFMQGNYKIYPNSILVDTINNTIKANLSIPSNAPTGNYSVYTGSSSCNVVGCGLCFIILPPTISAYPSKINVQQTLTVAINGSNTPFVIGSSCIIGKVVVNTSNVFFAQGANILYPSSIKLDTGYNRINAIFTIPANTPLGNYDLKVGIPNCNQIACYGCIYINNSNPGPSIQTGIVPNSICPGATISVPYSVVGQFTSNNTFYAELSDMNGQFTNPIKIGQKMDSVSSSFLCTIPTNTAFGGGYRIRVNSTSPISVGADNNSNITILASPLTVTHDTTICIGTSVKLTATGASGYRWSPYIGLSDSIGAQVIASPKSTITYSVRGNTSVGCQSTLKYVTVTVGLRDSTRLTPNVAACSGSNVWLGKYTSPNTSYMWTPGKGLSDSTIANPMAKCYATTKYVLKTTMYGCIRRDTVLLTIYPSVTVSIGKPNISCAGAPLTLTATSQGSTGLTWNTGEKTQSIVVRPMQTSSFSVYAFNAHCSAYDSVLVGIADPKSNFCNLVWPGDVDGNGVVNQYDLLSLGLYYGKTGPVRTSQGILWQGYASSDWPGTFSFGINPKKADCNGDGKVTSADKAAITKNYNLTHNKTEQEFKYSSANPDLYFVYKSSAVHKGDSISVELWSGKATSPVTNLYGLGFKLGYNNAMVVPGATKFAFCKSWLGADSLRLDTTFENDGVIAAAIVRNNNTDQSGYGKLADLKFKAATDMASLSSLELSFKEYEAINASYQRVYFNPINNSVVTGIVENSASKFFNVFPNPNNGSFTIEINPTENTEVSVVNILGESVFNQQVNNGQNNVVLKVEGLTAGIYFLKVQGETLYIKKIVVQ